MVNSLTQNRPSLRFLVKLTFLSMKTKFPQYEFILVLTTLLKLYLQTSENISFRKGLFPYELLPLLPQILSSDLKIVLYILQIPWRVKCYFSMAIKNDVY